MKIYIIGPSGAGKSHIASGLSAHFNIPLIEIDDIWLSHGGLSLYFTPEDKFTDKKLLLRENISQDVEREMLRPEWVIVGNYKAVRNKLINAADTIVLVDITVARNIRSLLGREITGKNRKRGYSFKNFLFHFPKAILENSRDRDKLRNAVESHHEKLVIIHNHAEADRYIRSLKH